MDRPERLAAAPDRRAGGPGVRRDPHLADRRGFLRGRRGQEPPPGRIDHRRGDRVRAAADGRRRDQAFLTAEISNSSVTLSLTRTPPPSSAAFQVTPQSLRLITTEPSKPTLRLPNGSLAAPSKVNGLR